MLLHDYMSTSLLSYHILFVFKAFILFFCLIALTSGMNYGKKSVICRHYFKIQSFKIIMLA